MAYELPRCSQVILGDFKMAGRKKETWTLERWLAYGNRVKRIREDVLSLLEDSQCVSGAKEMDVLCGILSKIDKYKSDMENIAAKTVRGASVTTIFYGDVFLEPGPKEKGSV